MGPADAAAASASGLSMRPRSCRNTAQGSGLPPGRAGGAVRPGGRGPRRGFGAARVTAPGGPPAIRRLRPRGEPSVTAGRTLSVASAARAAAAPPLRPRIRETLRCRSPALGASRPVRRSRPGSGRRCTGCARRSRPANRGRCRGRRRGRRGPFGAEGRGCLIGGIIVPEHSDRAVQTETEHDRGSGDDEAPAPEAGDVHAGGQPTHPASSGRRRRRFGVG